METHPRNDNPYTRTAPEYLRRGMSTFPVKGKALPLKDRTGMGGHCDETTVAKDLITRPYGYTNIAYRHDGTVAIDLDEYGEKHGVRDLTAFAVRHNLPDLPAAPSSTARGDDSPSRQYFFRLSDPTVRLDGKVGDAVEVCQRHHRFSVVWPSVHPDTGTIYTWYEPGEPGLPPTWGKPTETIPHRDDFPILPPEWEDALLYDGDESMLDLGVNLLGIPELVATFPSGVPCDRVKRASDIAKSHSGVHDHARDDLFKAFRLGIEGHPGADQLVSFLIAQRASYVRREHPDRNAQADVDKLVRDTAAYAQRTISTGSHATDCADLFGIGDSPPDRSRAPLVPLGSSTESDDTDTDDTPGELKPLGSSGGFVMAPTADDWDLSDDGTGVVESGFNLPAEVWEFSDEMRTIRQAAYSRKVSPDVVLHGSLAIIASLIHYTSSIETGVGPTPLNYYAAAVGSSGAGKTKGFAAADDLMASWVGGQKVQLGEDGYTRAELSTGEGMVEAFMGEVSEFTPKLDEHGDPLVDDDTGEPIGKWTKVRKQVRNNAMFVSDEGRQMLAHANRPGSTILNTLCSLWSGASAGSSNARTENTRNIDRNSYTIGLFVGFQPETMTGLFEDAFGGAPQRFLYASANPAPGTLPRTRIPFPDELAPQVPPYTGVNMALSEAQQDYVINHMVDVTEGIVEVGQFDGHRMLARCRVAALLTLLHSRGDTIPDDIWELAGIINDTSCALRDDLAERAAREAAELARQKQESQVKTNVTSAVLVAKTTKRDAAADRIVELVESTEDEAECTPRKIGKRLTASLRSVQEEALALALSDGRLESVNIPNPRNGPKTITILRVKD